MIGKARAQWRILTIIAVSMLLLMAIQAVAGTGTPDTSSRGKGNSGTQALYEWLSALGYDTRRMESGFTIGDADVVIINDPQQRITFDETTELVNFARRGGEVIVATNIEQTIPSLMAALEVTAQEDSVQSVRIAGDQGGDPEAKILEGSGQVLVWDGPRTTRLASAGLRDIAVAVDLGAGRVVLLGSPSIMRNAFLREGANAPFLLHQIEQLSPPTHGGPARIAFDDYHNQAAGDGSGTAEIFTGPLLLGMIVGIFALVAFLLASGRHLGRPRSTRDEGLVPSAAEYVLAVSQLFERSSDRGSVAKRYADDLKRRVGRLTSVDPRLDDEAFIAALQINDPVAAGPTAAWLARARSLAAGKPSESDLVALAKAVADLEGAIGSPLAQ